MRQEHSEQLTEKQIIEQLQRLAIPVPDPDFERDLRTKFIERATKKHRSKKRMRRLTWMGSVAAAALLGFLIYQNVNVSPMLESAERTLPDNVPQYSINGFEDDTVTITEAPKNPVQEKEYVDDNDMVVIADSNLYEIFNYGVGEIGDWRFYQNEEYNRIYISKDQVRAKLLYEVKEGYVNAHIFPIPNVLNQYVLRIIESGENEKSHLFYMNDTGSLTYIPTVPNEGYTNMDLKWSPNGSLALLSFENATTRTSLFGVLHMDKLSYSEIHGLLVPTQDPSQEAGYSNVSFSTWLNDRYILTFNNDTKTFYKLDATKEERAIFYGNTVQYNLTNGIELVGIGNNRAILKTGNFRYDVGFEPSYRLYLVNTDRANWITELTPEADVANHHYEQDFLGVTNDGLIVVSDILQADDYLLSVRVIDPLSEKSVWQFEAGYPRMIANPYSVLSPDRTKIAIRLYSEEVTTDSEGVQMYMPAPFYFVVLDLKNYRILHETEIDLYDTPIWVDEQKVQIGEHAIDVTKTIR